MFRCPSLFSPSTTAPTVSLHSLAAIKRNTNRLALSFIQDSTYLFSPLLTISPDKQSEKLIDIFICTVMKCERVRGNRGGKLDLQTKATGLVSILVRALENSNPCLELDESFVPEE